MTRKRKNLYRQALGKWGEDVAMRFLQEHGMTLLDRNYHTPDGELDLVMLAGETLVIVEVKTRRNSFFGNPEESVTDEKVEHIESAVDWFLQFKPEYSENWRLDVISVIGNPSLNNPRIDWFENVS